MKLVSVVTKDGYELHGLLCVPPDTSGSLTEKAVLHIHGLAGNFYENRFVFAIADELNEHGYAFLTANNRGAGVVSEFRKQTADGVEFVEAGGSREIFEDCAHDIYAWLDFLETNGYPQAILEGHSFGCLKAVFYQSHRVDSRVRAVILISPPDVFGYQYEEYGERFQSDLELARKLISEGKGSQFMPPDAYIYLIDANAFWTSLGPEAQTGIFNYFDPHASFVEIARIDVPIFACYGTNDEPVTIDPAECLEILKAKAVNSPKVTTKIIKGATHRYLGHEEELAVSIRKWLDKLS